mgnify:CR=1 FL=1
MKVAVMGAGSVGCYYGALLARAGATVTLVGRAVHVDAIQARGLLLETAAGQEAVRLQADTFVRLCAGQIRDERPVPAGVDPVDHLLGVLADKTGALIAAAARYGAQFSGCDAATVELMGAFGERLGLVFQLADDLLDVASDAEESGKTPGTDLRERVCPELLGVQQRAEGLAHALFRCSRPWNWATARFIISRARERSPA